jgi:hypothetical protein
MWHREDMRTWWRLGSLFVLGAALVTGCASKGSMTGEISTPAGPPRRVTFDYVADRTGDSGYLSVTLPTGESFNGPYARVGSAAAVAPGLDINFSVVDWGETADQWTFGQSDSDKVVALLQGSRGNKIRCRFTLRYAAGGLSDGGTGECQANTGEKIDVSF